jgi:signal transduction histidine kinase
MKMNILVVDDEVVMLDSIKIGLTNNGHQVTTALNALQALEQLFSQDQKIDLIITDYLMPGMTGLELLEAIRETHPALPVIIITAYTETSLVIDALKNHCDGFLTKPFSLDQLITEIDRVELHLLRNTNSSDLYQILPKIVHQINNPLATITCLSELLRRKLGANIDLQQWIDEILSAVQQISHINKDIINAGRMKRHEPIEIVPLLNDCLDMFQSLFTLKGILVTKKLPFEGVWVMGNRFELEQVFKNLILNATDAMNGRLKKKLSIAITQQSPASSVEITIEDTGCGIQSSLLNKIFDPYFSGKRDGNGLGLVIVKDIVESHQGKMLVESQMEIGSKFHILLPGMEKTKQTPADSSFNQQSHANLTCRPELKLHHSDIRRPFSAVGLGARP